MWCPDSPRVNFLLHGKFLCKSENNTEHYWCPMKPMVFPSRIISVFSIVLFLSMALPKVESFLAQEHAEWLGILLFHSDESPFSHLSCFSLVSIIVIIYISIRWRTEIGGRKLSRVLPILRRRLEGGGGSSQKMGKSPRRNSSPCGVRHTFRGRFRSSGWGSQIVRIRRLASICRLRGEFRIVNVQFPTFCWWFKRRICDLERGVGEWRANSAKLSDLPWGYSEKAGIHIRLRQPKHFRRILEGVSGGVSGMAGWTEIGECSASSL